MNFISFKQYTKNHMLNSKIAYQIFGELKGECNQPSIDGSLVDSFKQPAYLLT